MKNTQCGVTLTELLITVAIVGILTAIAVPSYSRYTLRTERQTGATCLMDVHQRMQSFNQSRGSYATALTALGYSSTTVTCAESKYAVTLETYDRLTASACGSTDRYQLRATAQTTAQATDGSLVLGFCNNINPGLRLIRDRELSDGVKKTWQEN